MTKKYLYIVFAIALSLLTGCGGSSTEEFNNSLQYGDIPECLKPICEESMSKVLVQTPTDANFAAGPTYPVTGDSRTTWWSDVEGSIQESVDRDTAIQLLVGMNSGLTRKIHVPLNYAMQNSGPRFTAGFAGGVYWEQTSVTSAGFLQFAVPPLPVGAKISSVKARWGNNFQTVAATSIGTPPTIALTKSRIAVGTTFVSGVGDPVTIGTQADTTAVLASYKALHDITLSVSETVSEDAVYAVQFTGEDGANESTGGVLAGIILTISLP